MASLTLQEYNIIPIIESYYFLLALDCFPIAVVWMLVCGLV